MRETSLPLRDLLYLDFDKAGSIWSQFEEGLTERLSVTEDSGKDRGAGTKFGLPGIAEANLGVDYQQKRSTLHSKTLHHDVLNRVEKRLTEAKLVADLSLELTEDESSPERIRAVVEKRPYLRAQGFSVLEDYRRILAIIEKFNDVGQFLTKIAQENLKKSPEYAQLTQLLTEMKKAAGAAPDRNRKAIEKAKANEIERQVQELCKPPITAPDDWLLKGIRLLIETFMPSRINFRIYPFHKCPSFQVLCNLKRECFVDADLEHLLYGYGNRPNVPLGVFGLVTSLPHKTEPTFDPMKEFEGTLAVQGQDKVAFEKAFRGVFTAIQAVESSFVIHVIPM
jgi:hypothetical protein